MNDLISALVTGLPVSLLVVAAEMDSIVLDAVAGFAVAGAVGVIVRRFVLFLAKEDRLKNKVDLSA